MIYITHDVNVLNHYFTDEYLAELPEELVDEKNPCCTDISGCEMLAGQKLQRVEGFYAGIRKDVSAEEYETAVAILRGIKAS